MRRWTARCALLLALVGAAGCAKVEPWQRKDLSLTPMELEACKIHRFETNIEVYREGAGGANGGKSGGGCGCS